MQTFFVKKETNTFTDAIECFGLVSIIEGVFDRVNSLRKPEILIEDKGICYQITCERDITEEMIEKCPYFDFIKFIATNRDNKSILEHFYIDMDEKVEKLKRYKSLSDEEKKNSDNFPDPDIDLYFLITNQGNIKAYRKLFYNQRQWKNHFSKLISFIFNFYKEIEIDYSGVEKEIKDYTKTHKLEIDSINALQDINPDKGKGANQLKANGIRPGGVPDLWLRQLIRFSGAWHSFISRYFEKNYKTYSLLPHSISSQYIESVYRGIKPFVRGKHSIKMDILMIHLLAKELIKRHPDYNNEDDFFSPSDKVSGFQMAYYQNLGQRPAVTNIGFLGLPDFIRIGDIEAGKIWISLLDEHQTVISRIDESNSSNIGMLQSYRQFISASDFMAFFDFSYDYAGFLIRSIDKQNYFIKAFTITNMEVLMCTKSNFSAILANPGFRAIAEAIRNSTIVPIIHGNKKDTVFGLSNRLKIAARNPESLMEEISKFLQQYNEAVMLKTYHKEVHRRFVTTEEIESFGRLLDERHPSKLVAGMLTAYGYAKEPVKEKENINEEEE